MGQFSGFPRLRDGRPVFVNRRVFNSNQFTTIVYIVITVYNKSWLTFFYFHNYSFDEDCFILTVADWSSLHRENKKKQ